MPRNRKKIIRACTVAQSTTFFADIMRKMRRDGYEMIAVTSPGAQLDALREEDGFVCYAVPMERHIAVWKDLKSLLRLISVFRRERPYIVHSITPKAGLLCMMAAWLTRVPVRIHTFTGLVWPTATGVKRRILMLTDWLTCACATHIIPEGQGVLHDLRNGGITKKPMQVLGYGNVSGVDMERFNPARITGVQKEEGVFTFLFVGRLVGDKGINELVEAFVRLKEKHGSIRLVLVGSYEENLDPVSPATKESINTNPAIMAVGVKQGDDLVREYAQADCFVLPSYREGFPNCVMEAGAMGLPTVVTDINGSREIIINGENGLIVPAKDALALEQAMERMLADKEGRERMSRNARELIASRYERSFVQNCQIEFYQSL